MASKYIDISTVKFFMNIVQELEVVLEKERFVDHDLESVNLYVESVKQFADRELFPYFKEMDENPAHYKDGSIHVHQQVEKMMKDFYGHASNLSNFNNLVFETFIFKNSFAF